MKLLKILLMLGCWASIAQASEACDPFTGLGTQLPDEEETVNFSEICDPFYGSEIRTTCTQTEGVMGAVEKMTEESLRMFICFKNQKKDLLNAACAAGNLDKVKEIVGKDSTIIESYNETDTYPLTCAVKNRHRNVVQFLLHAKANPNEEPKSDERLIEFVEDLPTLKLLISHKMNLKYRNTEYPHLLSFLATQCKDLSEDFEMVEDLLDHNPDIFRERYCPQCSVKHTVDGLLSCPKSSLDVKAFLKNYNSWSNIKNAEMFKLLISTDSIKRFSVDLVKLVYAYAASAPLENRHSLSFLPEDAHKELVRYEKALDKETL